MPKFVDATLPKVQQSAVPSVAQHVNIEWKNVVWVLIGIGIFFRVFHFLDNRSLWGDEMFLATSLVKLNFLELAKPMVEYEQKAPLGFLWVVRLMVLIFGNGEMALRLFPLVCGIASLFLFLPVTRYFLNPLGVVVAIGVLAAAPPLVYHAVEAKQYSTELFVTVVALYLYIRFHQNKSLSSLVLWGVCGAVLLWFSFSSVFILAGMAFGICLHYIIRKEWRLLFRYMIPFFIWFFSFAVTYILFTYHHGKSEWLIYFFKVKHSFMPFPPSSFSDLQWFFQKAFSVLHYPLGLSWVDLSPSANQALRVIARMSLLSLAVLAVGFAALYRKDRRQFMVLTFPLLLVLLASGLELYPFMDRLVVFLAPALILILALGCEKLTSFLFNKTNKRFILPALLLLGPIANATHQVFNPALFGDYKKSYQRETLSYIDSQYQEGDVVYIYWNELVGYRYYNGVRGFGFKAVEGKDYRYEAKNKAEYYERIRTDLKKLSDKKRIWLVYSNLIWAKIGDYEGQPAWYYAEPDDRRERLHELFSSMGSEVDSMATSEVRAYLFELEKSK